MAAGAYSLPSRALAYSGPRQASCRQKRANGWRSHLRMCSWQRAQWSTHPDPFRGSSLVADPERELAPGCASWLRSGCKNPTAAERSARGSGREQPTRTLSQSELDRDHLNAVHPPTQGRSRSMYLWMVSATRPARRSIRSRRKRLSRHQWQGGLNLSTGLFSARP